MSIIIKKQQIYAVIALFIEMIGQYKRSFLSDKKFIAELGKNAWEKAGEKYSPQTIFKMLEDMYARA